MGVEGVASARPMAPPSPTAADRLKRRSLTDDMCPVALEELSRRRTSIPPNFTYGLDHDDDDDVAATVPDRRWRSFDVTASTSTASSSACLASLATRIETEREELSAAEHAARPSRRRRRALLSLFSPQRKEEIELRRMEMVARVAKCNRSLVVLRDTLTTLELSAAEPTASLLDDLDLDADAVLADDCVHHILELQLAFLRHSAELHGDKKVAAPRAVSPAAALEQLLQDGVPCLVNDQPTETLVRFEKLLARYKVLKPSLKRSLDELCRDTMLSFTRPSHVPSIWDSRAPRDVLPSLVRELVDSVLETTPTLPTHLHAALQTVIEQMVFTRLAGACYRSLAVELDEQNAQWREQIVKARRLSLDEVGLPMDLGACDASKLFTQSIDAFNALPHLVPSSVLGAFMSAVRVLYKEATALLPLASGCISADVLLPLLVFVLSRTDLPHLHAQVFLMETFAIDESQEGSEAAYYVACLQAAMGYIMTEVGKVAAP